MLKLKYINSKGDEVLFGDEILLKIENSKPQYLPIENVNFYYLSHVGLDAIVASPILAKGFNQRGQTCVGQSIDERTVTIKGCLVSDSLAQDEKLRKQLHSTLSPLLHGRLEIYGETYVKALGDIQIINGVTFEDKDYNAPDGITYFSFQFIAPGNFLEDFAYAQFDLAEVNAMFEFPLVIDQTIIFGDMTNGKAEFTNDGDAPAPIIVQIPGPVKTPIITNETTGEFIQIKTPILAGETMIIKTAFGNKTVVIRDQNGVERNAFNYINLASTFFQLPIGENVLQFDAEEGNDTAKVKLSFKRLYNGI